MLNPDTIIPIILDEIPRRQQQLVDFVNRHMDPQMLSQFTGSPDPKVKFQVPSKLLEIGPLDAPMTKLIKATLNAANNLSHNLEVVQKENKFMILWHNIFSSKSFRGLTDILDPKMLDQSISFVLPIIDEMRVLYRDIEAATQPLQAAFTDSDAATGNQSVDDVLFTADTTLDAIEDLQYSHGSDSIRNAFSCLTMMTKLADKTFKLADDLAEPTEATVAEVVPLLHRTLAQIDHIEESLGITQGQFSEQVSSISRGLAILALKLRVEKDDPLHNPCANYRDQQREQRIDDIQQQLAALDSRRGEIEVMLKRSSLLKQYKRQEEEQQALLTGKRTVKQSLMNIFSKDQLGDGKHSKKTRERLRHDLKLIRQQIVQLEALKINTTELKEELSDIEYKRHQLTDRLARAKARSYQSIIDIHELPKIRRHVKKGDAVKPLAEDMPEADTRSELIKSLALVRDLVKALAHAIGQLMVKLCLSIYQAISINGQSACATPPSDRKLESPTPETETPKPPSMG